jgi:hypothetical protein
MSDPLFPFALGSDGKVKRADNAPRELSYTCLDHGCAMVLKRGEILTPHFAHTPGWAGECSGESMAHKASKLLLIEQIPKGLEVVRPDCKCGAKSKPFSVPAGSEGAEEVQVGRLRVDVAALANGVHVLYLECRKTHEVDAIKALELSGVGVPWVEVWADDVVNDPGTLYPIQGSDLFSLRLPCPACVDRIEQDGKRRRQYELTHAVEIAAAAKRSSARKTAEYESNLARIAKTAVVNRWACDSCKAVFNLPRVCCAVCGRFAPHEVQERRMRFGWPDTSTHEVRP